MTKTPVIVPPGSPSSQLSPARRAVLRRELVALRNELLVRQFRELATALGEAGIRVMPIKGILLHRLVYEHPGDRPMTDIDVLVPRERFEEAIAVARKLGYRATADPHGLAKAPCLRDRAASVDLHGQLFLPHVSGLTAAEMFSGARLDTDLLGVEVLAPASEHLLLHVLLHFAHHKLGQMGAPQEEDIRRILAKCQPHPRGFARLAKRLRSCHAAYYALAAAGVSHDSFAASLSVPLLARVPLARAAQRRQPAQGLGRLALSLLLLDGPVARAISIADYLTSYRARMA
jgi:hypothetical protein